MVGIVGRGVDVGIAARSVVELRLVGTDSGSVRGALGVRGLACADLTQRLLRAGDLGGRLVAF
ncbi:MAG: hypothetical protein L0H84_05345 [Pseudonocardia sp.]|nr:hypothetical protein [Pseudonocardia sp.]